MALIIKHNFHLGVLSLTHSPTYSISLCFCFYINLYLYLYLFLFHFTHKDIAREICILVLCIHAPSQTAASQEA